MRRIALLFMVVGLAFAQDKEARVWHPVAITDMATTIHTHVEVQGVVLSSRKEADGDRHLVLRDEIGHPLTVECIPELPALLVKCSAVKHGQNVKVRGISRFDKKHLWVEVHPVLSIEVVKP